MSPEERSKTLYLVDGTSQLFRAYFALPGLTSPKGLPTHAVYGFTTMLRKLISDERPQHIAVAFDLPGPTFRHDRYAEYKANRPPAPEDLNVQVPFAKEVCRAFRIPVLELAGYEADDLIATYTRLAREEGFEVVVVASDKDLLQLVGEGVKVLNPVKNVVLDPDGVGETFGVPPARVRDVLGLMGDSVDNIPGVPGVGEKTALGMVKTYGDVDAVLERARRFVELFDARDAVLAALDTVEKGGPLSEAHARDLAARTQAYQAALGALGENEADPEFRRRLAGVERVVAALEIAGLTARVDEPGRKVARSFRELKRELKALDKGSARRIWYSVNENADKALLSRELATVDREVPVSFDPEAVAVGPPDRDKARALFVDLNFKALLVEFGEGEGGSSTAEPSESEGREYGAVLTREELVRLVEACRAAGRFAVAVETDGPDPVRARLVGISLAHDEGPAAYVPLGHHYLGAPCQISLDVARDLLGPLLADGSIEKIAHDLKSDIHVLGRHGLPVHGWGKDTMVAAFLLDPGRPSFTPDALAKEHLGREILTFEEVAGAGVKQVTLDRVEVASVTDYAAQRADAILALSDLLGKRLREADLLELYETIDGPLLPILARMEAHGIRIDSDMLRAMSVQMARALDASRSEIHALAGLEFNVDSPKQLREILFERMGITPRHKTAGGVSSTDARVLEELAEEHDIARKVLEYRELAKLKGTYVDALPELVNPETGRVHTRYHPTGAATGRLSSSDPNLQNIPARTEAGLRIRSAFVPEPGYVFLASDYSQVELRILAHLSNDAELLAAFLRGDDIHRHTASLVYGVVPDLVTDTMRRRAKAVNFGIVYGMSEVRLAAEQGMRRTDARQFIRAYFERFQGVRDYIDRTREQAKRDAAVRTLFGRVRLFPQLRQKGGRAAQAALRAAVNTTVQGTAADLMKMAMLRVDRQLRHDGLQARMLLQVHDELLFEVPEAEIEPTGAMVKTAMEEVHRLQVPLVVDQKIGPSWKDVT